MAGFREITPEPLNFKYFDSLIYKPSKHKIIDLNPSQKNIEISFIILEKKNDVKTKNGQVITTFLISDETASVFINFFNESGSALKVGDIVYLNGAYATIFQE